MIRKTLVSQSRVLAFGATVLLAVTFSGKTAIAQEKNLVFNKLRQLPDLGACPTDPASADPDLKKALTIAVTQAKDQARDMADSAERMRDAGLVAPDIAKQLRDSTEKLQAALKDPDVCVAARAFAQLSPSAAVQTPAPAQTPAAPTPDGTCENGPPPCIYQPYEGQTSVKGKLKLDAGTKVSDNTSAVLQIGDRKKPVKFAADTGEFEYPAGVVLNSDNKVELVQTEANEESFKSGQVAVKKTSGLRDKISISTDVLDFGHQSMQTSSDPKPVTVTSSSDDKLTLQFLTSTVQSRNFQVSGCQNPIDKGQQCTFNVTFTPYPAKMNERYLAVVPTGAAQTFEAMRRDLSEAEGKAAKAEEVWRVTARCADEDFLRRDPDCPKTLGVKDSAGKVMDPEKPEDDKPLTIEERKQDKEVVRTAAGKIAKTKFASYAAVRNQVAQAEQALRSQFNVITLRAVPDHWKFPFTRAVVGIDMSAPTSNTLKQSYFVDFNLLAPLKLPFAKKNEDPLENRLWVWLNPRITSLPQATNFSAVSTINETGSFFDTTGKVNDIANGIDVSGGFEVALVKPRDGIPWWGEYVNTQARLATSLILGVGISTPFSTSSTEVQSNVTQAICDSFKAPGTQTVSDANGLVCGVQDGKAAIKVSPNPDITGDTGLRSFVDFFTPDRSRFFRRYYAGLRFKTYFFNRDVHSYCKPFERRPGDEGDCAAPYDIFPGIIDLTFGRDEAVTAGRLSGWLLRVEGVYPLPWYQGIHLFGSIYTRLAGNHTDQPFGPYTVQKPQEGAATDLNTFRFGLHPLDRDYFRVGVGVDLIQVFKKTGQPKKDAPQAPAADQ